MKKLLRLLASLLISSPALASPNLPGINAVSTNQAVNTQSAIGSVNQAPVGGINNNSQINNSQATDYGFAPGIYCRGSNFAIGGYGSGANSNGYGSNDYGIIALLNIPLGGNIADNCKTLAREIAKQRQLDTAYTMIKVCSSLKKDNISLNYEVFPDFKICESVNISSKTTIPDLRSSPFSPKESTTVTVPVK